METGKVKALTDRLVGETEKIMIGKRRQIEMIVMSILAGGHILIDDLPGSGKTTLVKTLSIALGCDFRRVQFTPDLLPSDIIGVNIFNQQTGSFQFVEGPVNTNILLADEINRAIPRTQSALLEAMEEKQVTVDGVTRRLPQPFIVLATQNPVESESTFRLPAAQMDRFFIRLSLGYPSPEEEVEMLRNLGDRIPFEQVVRVTDPKELEELQGETERVEVSDAVKEYIVSLVYGTREHRMIRYGASPRASRSLFRAGKVWAAMQGRAYVTPEDIQAIAAFVLEHRITVSSEAHFTKKSETELIREVMESTAVPPEREAYFCDR